MWQSKRSMGDPDLAVIKGRVLNNHNKYFQIYR